MKVVRDAKLKLTSFDYEPFGNLSKTVDPNGNVITVEYDLLGRKTNLREPDLGWIHYDNNPLGQTYAQISPRQRALGQKTGMKYDQLGRMTARYETDLESHWVFDTALTGIGQLAEAYTGTASAKDYRRIHNYDSFGRPKQTQQVLTDGLYNSTLEYDTWGRVVRHTQQRGSDGAKIFDSRYDSTGGVSEVWRGSLILWKVSEQDAALRAVALALGNGLTQTRVYNRYSARVESGELKPGAGAALLTEGYQYDEIGSVRQRTQYWDVGGFQESFEYDELNRIRTSAVLMQAPQTFTYDDAGNIKTKTNVGTGPYVYPAQGAAAVRLHAVQSIPGIGSFAYDLNGNLETGAGRAVAWTSFDMPQKIEKGGVSATFAYGAEHQRTRQNRSDGSVVVYAGAQEVETKAGQVTVKTYWPGGIGVEIDRPGAATELRWMHIDRLGSVIALTDQNGAISERLAYDAWGKRRTLDGAPIGASATPDSIDGQVDNRGFTGHEMLDQLDLVHMNGRVYDPLVARFMSGDPLIDEPTNGQNYNRYSYVLNNPTNFTDPTGFSKSCAAPTTGSNIPICNSGADDVVVNRPGGEREILPGNGTGRTVEKVAAALGLKMAPDGVQAASAKGNSENTKTAEPAFVAKHPATNHFLAADKWDRLSEYFAERKQKTGNFLYGNLSQWTGYVADHLDDIIAVAGSMRGVKGGPGKLGVPEEGFVPNAKVTEPYVRPSVLGRTADQKAAVQGKPCVECGALSKNQVADHKDPLVVQHYREGKVNVEQQRSVGAVQPHCPQCSARQGGYLSAFSRTMRELFGF